MPNSDMDTLIAVFAEAQQKCRYGNLWSDFTVAELLEYSRIKAKRGLSLYNRCQVENAKDDLLDAANLALMAVVRIDELSVDFEKSP